MANEIEFQFSLQIKKSNLEYRALPNSFKANMDGAADGPTPGTIAVPVAPGVNVDLSELSTPGVCVIQNLDTTNYVMGGSYDPENNLFYPLMEWLPGEIWPFRLARDLGEEYATGTGTVGPETNTFRLIAVGGTCNVKVEAFVK